MTFAANRTERNGKSILVRHLVWHLSKNFICCMQELVTVLRYNHNISLGSFGARIPLRLWPCRIFTPKLLHELVWFYPMNMSFNFKNPNPLQLAEVFVMTLNWVSVKTKTLNSSICCVWIKDTIVTWVGYLRPLFDEWFIETFANTPVVDNEGLPRVGMFCKENQTLPTMQCWSRLSRWVLDRPF